MVDTHTADGIKVGWEYQEPGVPLICLETALPVKFEDAVMEALGEMPPCPAGYEQLTSLPQRYMLMDNDVAAIKTYIVNHCAE